MLKKGPQKTERPPLLHKRGSGIVQKKAPKVPFSLH